MDKIEIDGITYYDNDRLGIELEPVPSCYEFWENERRILSDWNNTFGWAIGTDSFLEGHVVIKWDDDGIGSIHKSHVEYV